MIPPRFEFGTARQKQTFEKWLLGCLDQRFQIGRAYGIEIVRPQPRDVPKIEFDHLRIEEGPAVVRCQTFLPISVGYSPDLMETPTKGRTRIVRRLPKQLAEMISPQRAAHDRQVGKQGTGLF